IEVDRARNIGDMPLCNGRRIEYVAVWFGICAEIRKPDHSPDEQQTQCRCRAEGHDLAGPDRHVECCPTMRKAVRIISGSAAPITMTDRATSGAPNITNKMLSNRPYRLSRNV